MITNEGIKSAVENAAICGACIEVCRDIIGAERMLKKGDKNAE